MRQLRPFAPAAIALFVAMALEGVIRVLADEFDVPCAEGSDIWRPALREAERVFASIAHDRVP